MQTADIYPTEFAKAICRKVGLYNTDITKSGGEHNKQDMTWHFGLAEFQQMVIGGATFDEACLAYYGVELSEEQIQILKVVEKSTKPWLLGHIAGVLTDKLKNRMNPTEVANVILNEIMHKNGEITKAKAKGLMIKLKKL